MTIASPCGRSRSSTACASAQRRPRRRRASSPTTPGRAAARLQPRSAGTTSGTRRDRDEQDLVWSPPYWAATISPTRPRKPARRDGRGVGEHGEELVQADQRRARSARPRRPGRRCDDERDRERRRPGSRRGCAPRGPSPCLRRGAPRLAPRRRHLSGPRSGARGLRTRPAQRSNARAVEVGPQLVGEDQLGVGGLPQQVVGQPLLAAGADDQVGVVHLGRVEQRAERLLAAARRSARPRRGSPSRPP